MLVDRLGRLTKSCYDMPPNETGASMSIFGDVEPEALMTRTFGASVRNFSMVKSFKRIAALGLPAAQEQILHESIQFADQIFTDKEYDDLFVDKDVAFNFIGSTANMGKAVTSRTISQFKLSVDSSVLIFCHSILDASAFDYCKVSAIADPKSWTKFLEKKQVTLADMRDFSYEQILGRKLEKYFESLERESLLAKIDKLFEICRPPDDFKPIKNYNFDRQAIQKFDRRRHEIVHGELVMHSLPVNDSEIDYYMSTCNYLMGLLNHKFGLRVDQTSFLKSMAETPATVDQPKSC